MNVTAINLPQNISVALLVIAGQYGNGEERKQKLTKAGYNPSTIQACVNDIYPILQKYGG
jgi:hypothetical protein|nr:MAG TPA: CW7 repeat protein [Caudoviricetes sp.]